MSSFSSKDDQTSFLQRKKEEILARKNQMKTANTAAATMTTATVQQAKTVIKTENNDTPKLPFANDGSFMERFKAMQKQQHLHSPSTMSNSSMVTTQNKISESSSYTTNSQIKIKTEPIVHNAPKQKPQLQKAPSIFEAPSEVSENSSSAYDAATDLAEQVVARGFHIEDEARQKCQADARYRFLFDSSSPVAKYYQTHIQNLKKSELKRKWNKDLSPSSSSTEQPVSSSVTAPADFHSEFEKAKALVRAKAAALMSGGPTAAAQVKSEEEQKRQRDIEEQRMMNEIYRKVIAQQAAEVQANSKKRKKDKPKYEYDSDEEVDGGTWEHKKRMDEMEKTKQWAMELTTNSQGKHHLADFLPPDELEKFIEKVKAVREGREADFSDYSKFRIQDDNVGFKLLQKAGWKEGEGLGAKKEGIKEPINKGKTSFDQAGVGADKPAEVKKDDDDFELYRKRMMLSYKFRPNPLNNPRRPYY